MDFQKDVDDEFLFDSNSYTEDYDYLSDGDLDDGWTITPRPRVMVSILPPSSILAA
jgi:hypothetical protein